MAAFLQTSKGVGVDVFVIIFYLHSMAPQSTHVYS